MRRWLAKAPSSLMDNMLKLGDVMGVVPRFNQRDVSFGADNFKNSHRSLSANNAERLHYRRLVLLPTLPVCDTGWVDLWV